MNITYNLRENRSCKSPPPEHNSSMTTSYTYFWFTFFPACRGGEVIL